MVDVQKKLFNLEKGHKLKKSDLDLLDKISDLILTENIQELKDLDKKLF